MPDTILLAVTVPDSRKSAVGLGSNLTVILREKPPIPTVCVSILTYMKISVEQEL
jgi:hypothetical protein